MDSLLIGRGERCLHSDWTEQFNIVKATPKVFLVLAKNLKRVIQSTGLTLEFSDPLITVYKPSTCNAFVTSRFCE